MTDSDIQRFWAKVEIVDGCWLWTGFIDPDGHGQFWWDGRDRPAHRFAWIEIAGKPLAKRKHLHHECINKHCVKPAHLISITKAHHASIHGRAQTHCRRGNHPLSGSNLWVSSTGRRCCRKCRREAVRRHRMGERAAVD